jgi:hypothetical protein
LRRIRPQYSREYRASAKGTNKLFTFGQNPGISRWYS